LAIAFPGSNGTLVDFFDPATMTEPSISRARHVAASAAESIRVNASALPFANEELDAAFVFFSAHELRQAEARTQFFGELRRVLKPSGRIVLLEHLRDWPNFLAFGPGSFHFLSRRTWMSGIESSDLALIQESAVTAFVRVLVLARGERSICSG
jgi:ubiquinone/menaquinone biosynthesis C-methylase UbiE